MKVPRRSGALLLIDNYDSFTWNIFQLLSELGARVKVVRNDRISIDAIERLDPAGIVISPGPGSPDEAGITLEIITRLSGRIPILGVCLGHQAIGQAFGGRVVRAPRMMHGKVSEVIHRGKGVFSGLKSPLLATRYHSLIVERSSLPSCLEITARTNDGIIMGIRHRKFPVEGVQFHPESILTQSGKSMFAEFLSRRRN